MRNKFSIVFVSYVLAFAGVTWADAPLYRKYVKLRVGSCTVATFESPQRIGPESKLSSATYRTAVLKGYVLEAAVIWPKGTKEKLGDAASQVVGPRVGDQMVVALRKWDEGACKSMKVSEQAYILSAGCDTPGSELFECSVPLPIVEPVSEIPKQ